MRGYSSSNISGLHKLPNHAFEKVPAISYFGATSLAHEVAIDTKVADIGLASLRISERQVEIPATIFIAFEVEARQALRNDAHTTGIGHRFFQSIDQAHHHMASGITAAFAVISDGRHHMLAIHAAYCDGTAMNVRRILKHHRQDGVCSINPAHNWHFQCDDRNSGSFDVAVSQ